MVRGDNHSGARALRIAADYTWPKAHMLIPPIAAAAGLELEGALQDHEEIHP